MRFFQFPLWTTLLALWLFFPSNGTAADFSTDWEKVEAAEKKGLPQTALAAVEPIITSALASQDYNTALKAILMKSQFVTKIEGRTEGAQIQVLSSYLEQAPPKLKPLLSAALAKVWQNYYNGNRWQLLQRSRAQTNDTDFLTWDATRVLAEIDRLYTLALSDPAVLQTTPVSAFGRVLVKEDKATDALRPTLYDFLVHDAIAFYSLGEQGVAQSEDHFQPDANSPIFGTLEEFLAWQPRVTEPASPTLKAIRLFQDVLRFHQNDTFSLVLSDAELHRIRWAKQTLGKAEGTGARYEKALRAFIERWKSHAPASEAAADLAEFLQGGENEIFEKDDGETSSRSAAASALEAYKAATLGIALHPNSTGASRCRGIIHDLEARELAWMRAESVWNAPWPDIEVSYKNLDKLYFRAVPANWHDFLERHRNRPESLNIQELTALLKKSAAKTWQVSLPRAQYTRHSHRITAPDDLAPGFYFLIASVDESFSQKENALSHTPVWVSDLALVTGNDLAVRIKPDDNIQGYVLHAGSGEPVADATITGWYLDRTQTRVAIPSVKTDATGAFSLQSPSPNNTLLLVESGTHKVSNNSQMFYQGGRRTTADRTRHYIHFLTDRSIYRPGQTIQFKGVVYAANRDTNHYEVVAGKKVTVVIDDPNGKEAGRLELYTNGYGSVSGSFVVPPGRLNGRYSLHTTGAENGRGYVQIEEYKRPKFEVVLKAPETAPKLDGPVSLTGTATAYTGASIDNAQVKWSVKRTVRWPRWCWWFPPRGSERAIAHGTATTDATGKFTVEFTAAPDKTADPKNEPRFDYIVSVEVTDGTGETRDANQLVTVGYTTLQAEVSVEEWQTTDQPVSLKITTTSLDNVPQKASGKLTIYSLKQPEQVVRSKLSSPSFYFPRSPRSNLEEDNASNPRAWEEDAGVESLTFITDEKGLATLSARLPAGVYRAVLTTQDRFNQPVSARTEIIVRNLTAEKSDVRVPFSLNVEKDTLQPGDTFTALWSTGYDTGRALVSLEHRGKILQRFWTDPARTQQKITLPVTEDLRGGFTLKVLQVRENRIYTTSDLIQVPWKNKRLTLGWERFNSKLVPGGRETWTLRIQNPDDIGAVAELTAALYDASLDQFRAHGWNDLHGIFYREAWPSFSPSFANQSHSVYPRINDLDKPRETDIDSFYPYRRWISFVDEFSVYPRRAFGMAAPVASMSVSLERSAVAKDAAPMPASLEVGGQSDSSAEASGDTSSSSSDLDTITARKNLQETAFFFPALVSESDGTVRLEFTAPEALTRWNFLGFAHDRQLRSAVFTDDTAVTSKDLMVQPNPPRFVREGDTLEITVKVTNKTDKTQTGKVRLTFSDALTLDPVDVRLGNGTPDKSFILAANSSTSLAWRIQVPDGQGFLIYKAVGAAGLVSDGEEGFLPVLSRRQLVTESVPLPIRGATTKQFRFEKLLASGTDATLRHESLTVQMVSNPAWYAVMALPYLMEYPHECNEQIFGRLYANALARHIANSNPKIARVFEQWKNTPALDSPLFKNEDLKSVLISETPWVRAAEGESAQRRNMGILFDKNRTDAELTTLSRKLTTRQLPDGRWSWFPEGPASDYITRYIVAGYGRLHNLGVEVDTAPAKRALPALDAWLDKELADIKKSAAKRNADYRKEDHLSPLIAFHLYMRSFFLKEAPIAKPHQEAYDFFREQGSRHWLKLGRQSQGHLALALHRFGDNTSALAIVASLKEHAKTDDELGMYWNDPVRGWFWWQAPIETQALMIEVFDTVARDATAVEALQTWLLKQKQTQAWPTTKSTADAVYALLLRGTDKLASDALVKVSLGGKTVQPKNVEAGTGFYAERLDGTAVNPALGEITVTKTDDGVAWGSVTWQYFQNLEKITPHDGTPLKLKKTLWKKVRTQQGDELVSIPQNKVNVGDTVIVRIELRVDRDMEFVHLKDQRGSGTEPVNVISGYRWRDGLGHYESTGDTATHFFIDWLRRGTYVFEYPVRVQLRGNYQSGIAEVQCMYAPEFNSHSASIPLIVE